MAVSLFDIEAVVAVTPEISGITDEERGLLFRKSVITTSKPKEAGGVAPILAVTSGEPISLEDLSLAYEELLVKAEGLMDKLKARASGLTYFFDPLMHPDLSENVASLFAGESSRITSEMYFMALELDRELALSLGGS